MFFFAHILTIPKEKNCRVSFAQFHENRNAGKNSTIDYSNVHPSEFCVTPLKIRVAFTSLRVCANRQSLQRRNKMRTVCHST